MDSPKKANHTERVSLGWGHDDVMKWKHFPRYWPFLRGIHRSPVNSPHKGQWRGALMFYLICAWINGWVINREAGDLRRHRPHYDIIIMHQIELLPTHSVLFSNMRFILALVYLTSAYSDVAHNSPWFPVDQFIRDAPPDQMLGKWLAA